MIISVNPGFGGQSFTESQVKEISELRKLCAEKVSLLHKLISMVLISGCRHYGQSADNLIVCIIFGRELTPGLKSMEGLVLKMHTRYCLLISKPFEHVL